LKAKKKKNNNNNVIKPLFCKGEKRRKKIACLWFNCTSIACNEIHGKICVLVITYANTKINVLITLVHILNIKPIIILNNSSVNTKYKVNNFTFQTKITNVVIITIKILIKILFKGRIYY